MRTEEEIKETIELVWDRLKEKEINRYCNAPVKEGYLEVLSILESKSGSVEKIASRVISTQGRFIAWLGLDYLNGECDQKTLVGVPLKKK